MNNTIKELYSRKSVRVFTDQVISEVNRKLILESAIQAPTAGNMQLYTILDVQDQNKKNQLADLCDHQPFIAKAKMILIFFSDASRWYRNYNRFVSRAKEARPTLNDYYLGLCDAMVAAQNSVVAAESLGIGSCYIGDIVENYEVVKQMFDLPSDVLPVGMLVFGYPTQQQKLRPKPIRLDVEDVVYIDTYRHISDDDLVLLFAKRIQFNQKIDEEQALIKAKEQIEFMYGFKQDTPFFREMNRCLKLMLKDYFD